MNNFFWQVNIFSSSGFLLFANPIRGCLSSILNSKQRASAAMWSQNTGLETVHNSETDGNIRNWRHVETVYCYTFAVEARPFFVLCFISFVVWGFMTVEFLFYQDKIRSYRLTTCHWICINVCKRLHRVHIILQTHCMPLVTSTGRFKTLAGSWPL